MNSNTVEQDHLILDRTAVLDRVGGDETLLREITAIFLSEYPILLGDIRAALGAGDLHALEKSAHSLKGAVSNFGAETATQAAYRVETLARHQRLAEIVPAVSELELQFHLLQPALQRLL